VRVLQHDLIETLSKVNVKTSPNIKSHYTISAGRSIEQRTVTKTEGGSSVQVFTTTDGNQPSLEIYLSTDMAKRQCAVVTTLASQLVEALEIHTVDIASEVSQLLLVPVSALDQVLMEHGIVGETISQSQIRNEAIEVNQFDEGLDPEVENSNSSIHSQLDSMSVAQASESDSTDSSEDVVEMLTARLRGNQNHYVSAPRSSTPPVQVRAPLEGHTVRDSLEMPLARSATETATTARTYNANNRGQNIDRLRNFARNTETVFNPQAQRTRRRPSVPDGVFDLEDLEVALDETELVPSPVAPTINRMIHNRTSEQWERDFEVGFLGEYFVSPLSSKWSKATD
jgi:hypothetical protein